MVLGIASWPHSVSFFLITKPHALDLMNPQELNLPKIAKELDIALSERRLGWSRAER
jgi:hypothetical protein